MQVRALASGRPSSGAHVGDAWLVVDLVALGPIASTVARDLVVECVWSAGCDGYDVVDLEAVGVVVVCFVVDGFFAPVAGWVVLGDGVAVFVSGRGVARCPCADHGVSSR